MGNGFRFLLLSLVLVFCNGDRNIDPDLQKAIDAVVQEVYLPLSNIQSLGLAIVQNDGEVLYTTGYGLANEEKGILNENTTQFLVASVTKSFTSTIAVRVLHEKFPEMGEAVLDTPIRKLLPAVNFTLIDRFRTEHANFRDLLSHRLCLFRDDIQLWAEPFNTSSEITYRLRYNDEICGVRTQFQYNNQLYVMAGELIGILAGKPFEDLVQQLLTEIGMTESALLKTTDDFTQMPNRAMPYYVQNNVSYPGNTDLIKRVVPTVAAGGLYLTPNDMAKYVRFRLNLGKVGGKQVVPQECMEWMNKIANQLPWVGYKQEAGQSIRSYYGYGLGLMIGHYNGWQHLQHGGYFPPYSSLMSVFPVKKLGILSSANQGPALVDPQLLHEALFDVITGDDVKSTIENFRRTAEAHVRSVMMKKEQDKGVVAKLLEEYAKQPNLLKSSLVGKYGSGSAGDLIIEERNNEVTNSTGLYLSYGKWYQGWVELVSGNVYKLVYDTDAAQDNYATGSTDDFIYLRVENETIVFFQPSPGGDSVLGKFRLGVSLDILPEVPYNPGSCGLE